MSSSTKRKIFFDEILRVLHVFVCASGMPGYLLSALITDTFGRRFIQIRGFAIFTVILLAIGFGYGTFDKMSLIAFYILAQLFFNFGPNAKTLVVPAKCFPTRFRGTCCGLCAATEKLGAVIISVLSQPLLTMGVRARCKGEDAVRFWGM
jgi:PHS family inorganic phosphate transporter-like MFS transporter